MKNKTTLHTPETSSQNSAEELNKRVVDLIKKLKRIQKVKSDLLKILNKKKPE